MSRRVLGRVSGAMGALLLAACGGATGNGGDGSVPSSIGVLALSEPVAQIGAVDGADEYLFGAITSALRLEEGGFAVADGQAGHVSIYDADGVFLRRWGGEGDGPGEFRNISKLYRVGPDSVMVAHGFSPRVTVFSTDGAVGRDLPAAELTGDETFALDSWLYGRFWVNGAMTEAERAAARSVLDRLPPPRQAPGYRSVEVDASGRVWVIEPGAAGATSWTRFDEAGSPTVTVSFPDAFRPTHLLENEVVGVWWDEQDVSYVRVYRLEETEQLVAPPAWLTAEDAATTAEAAPDATEMRELIVGALKEVASHQEIYYSQHYSYTSDVTALEDFEQPEGLHIDFPSGSPRGWTGVFVHDDADFICGLAYGFDLPAGWVPGAVTCGTAPATAEGEG